MENVQCYMFDFAGKLIHIDTRRLANEYLWWAQNLFVQVAACISFCHQREMRSMLKITLAFPFTRRACSFMYSFMHLLRFLFHHVHPNTQVHASRQFILLQLHLFDDVSLSIQLSVRVFFMLTWTFVTMVCHANNRIKLEC